MGRGIGHPPGEAFRFVGIGEQPGVLQVEQLDQGLVLYSWPCSRLTVYHKDEVVWEDFGVPVPPLPEGMSTSSFVETVFHLQKSPHQLKPKSWWMFW